MSCQKGQTPEVLDLAIVVAEVAVVAAAAAVSAAAEKVGPLRCLNTNAGKPWRFRMMRGVGKLYVFRPHFIAILYLYI